MTDQMILIDTDDTAAVWHLDAATRETGRRGVARARAALQAAGRDRRAGIVSSDDLPAAA